CFGGTVNCKYLIAYKGLDDEFDTDFGYRGKCQFLFGFRDPNMADISGSNGFESDNDGTGTLNSPRTQPIFSNVTLIGPLPSPDFTQFNSNYKRGAHLRRSALTSIYNSIIMGYPVGLLIDGQNSADGAIANDLQIRNTIIAGSQSGKNLTTNVNGFDVVTWFNNPDFGNKTFDKSSDVGLIDPFNLTNPNPIPASNSYASTNASFNNDRLKDNFFTHVNYIGAFNPNGPRWDERWTNYDPQNTDYTLTDVKETYNKNIPADFQLYQNYPNPFNPNTTISFTLPKSGYVNLIVYNSLGQEIAKLIDGYKDAGTYFINWNAENLPSGVYIYKLESNNFTAVKKMTLMK
ncbi:MAG: T9SS type A sorting domain-containing protein, partial [Melioribacter sp.]|nr:T9SS type A sorting domain-containing protein [Melioribacter sp.]